MIDEQMMRSHRFKALCRSAISAASLLETEDHGTTRVLSTMKNDDFSDSTMIEVIADLPDNYCACNEHIVFTVCQLTDAVMMTIQCDEWRIAYIAPDDGVEPMFKVESRGCFGSRNRIRCVFDALDRAMEGGLLVAGFRGHRPSPIPHENYRNWSNKNERHPYVDDIVFRICLEVEVSRLQAASRKEAGNEQA